MVKFTLKEKEKFSVLEFTLDGPISPSELKSLIIPKINFKKGIIITGRGPVWLYGYLVHELHPAAWVACFDPRLGGVVVQSHSPGLTPGDVVSIEEGDN